jgi:hypothetical protein
LVEKALKLSPQMAEAYLLLGDIDYGSQKLKEAKRSWEQARKLNPNLSGLQDRLNRLEREMPVESEFDRLSHFYFDLRYEDSVERSTGFDMQDMLMEARRTIGADFRHWPKYATVVLIYSAANFRRIRQEAPEWVGGQFDGKIRVPLPDSEYDLADIKMILFHEYTHVLVRDLTGGRCPTWLNEGLAEYGGAKSGLRRTEALYAAMHAEQLIPWAELDSQFSYSSPPERVYLAYQQSHSIIAYIAQRYGFWRLRKILTAVSGGTPVLEALSKEFSIKIDRLERNWREWLPGFAR